LREPYLIKMLYQLKDNEDTDESHKDECGKEHFFGNALKPVPSLLPAAAQGDLRVNACCQKQKGIERQQLFTVAFNVGEPPAHDENAASAKKDLQP